MSTYDIIIDFKIDYTYDIYNMNNMNNMNKLYYRFL